VAGVVSARLMKGLWDAPAAKDGMVEGGTLMAGAVGQIAVPLIPSLAASALVRWAKSWRSDAHGDGCGAWRCGRAGRDHEVSFQKGFGGACPHRQMASVIIGPPQHGQRCVAARRSAVTAALSTSGSLWFCCGLANSLRHNSSLAAR
jgi:hypothetical protein